MHTTRVVKPKFKKIDLSRASNVQNEASNNYHINRNTQHVTSNEKKQVSNVNL